MIVLDFRRTKKVSMPYYFGAFNWFVSPIVKDHADGVINIKTSAGEVSVKQNAGTISIKKSSGEITIN